MPILDIDAVNDFYKTVTFQLKVTPHKMPPFNINGIDTPEDVFTNMWPLRQFPIPLKHINVVAKHELVGIDCEKTVPFFRWRVYKQWHYLRGLTRWACLMRCRTLRNELLVRAVAAGKL